MGGLFHLNIKLSNKISHFDKFYLEQLLKELGLNTFWNYTARKCQVNKLTTLNKIRNPNLKQG